MSHTVHQTKTSRLESSGPGTARDALNRRRNRLTARGVATSVDGLTLKYVDHEGDEVTLTYRDDIQAVTE